MTHMEDNTQSEAKARLQTTHDSVQGLVTELIGWVRLTGLRIRKSLLMNLFYRDIWAT